MKMRLLRCLCLFLCAALLAGCQLTPASTTSAPATTQPPTTTAPPETTVPPTTEAPFQVSVDAIVRFLDEAGEYLDSNDVITLGGNYYTTKYVKSTELEKDSAVSAVYKTEDMLESVTITNGKDSERYEELRYLIFLDRVIADYKEYLYWEDWDWDINGNMPQLHDLTFCTDYPSLGYSSVKEYVDSGVGNKLLEFWIAFDYPAVFSNGSFVIYDIEYPCVYFGTATP